MRRGSVVVHRVALFPGDAEEQKAIAVAAGDGIGDDGVERGVDV